MFGKNAIFIKAKIWEGSKLGKIAVLDQSRHARELAVGKTVVAEKEGRREELHIDREALDVESIFSIGCTVLFRFHAHFSLSHVGEIAIKGGTHGKRNDKSCKVYVSA